MIEDRVPGFSTLAVHAGELPDPAAAGYIPPDGPLTALALGLPDGTGAVDGRPADSVVAILEERIAALEGGSAALAVASGSTARLVVLRMLMSPGDEFIAARRLHPETIVQFGHAFTSFGWQVKWADIDDIASFENAVSPKTKAIFVESIANPGGIVTDIAAVAKVAKRAGVPLIVDNTLATPYLTRPLDHGADIVVHSFAAFLGGNGGTAGGAIVDGGRFNWMANKGRFPLLSEPRPGQGDVVVGEAFGNFAFAAAARMDGLRDTGAALSPANAHLALGGIETLPLRMRKHCDNARAVAEFLAGQDKVTWVSYAGLPGDRYHQLSLKYCPQGAGAALTFGVEGGKEAALRILSEVQLFASASVGGTRSHIGHPASTTHRQLAPEERAAAGAGTDVVLVWVGIEDAADLVADLEQALAKA